MIASEKTLHEPCQSTLYSDEDDNERYLECSFSMTFLQKAKKNDLSKYFCYPLGLSGGQKKSCETMGFVLAPIKPRACDGFQEVFL